MTKMITKAGFEAMRYLRANGGAEYGQVKAHTLPFVGTFGGYGKAEMFDRIWQRLRDAKKVEIHNPEVTPLFFVLTIAGHKALTDQDTKLTHSTVFKAAKTHETAQLTPSNAWASSFLAPPVRAGALDHLKYKSRGM